MEMYPKEENVSIDKTLTIAFLVVTLQFINATHGLPQCSALYVSKHPHKLRLNTKDISALTF